MKILKVYADWCGPCKELSKRLDQLNIECENINIDSLDGEGITTKYNVRSIPTLLILDDEGNLLRRQTGLHSNDEIKQFIYETN